MQNWIGIIPKIDWALGVAVGFSVLLALTTRQRGGRFRGLMGWAGFWVVFSGILVCLSRGWPWVALTLLGLLMFAGLRTYFFLAPVRPRDRYAVLIAYLAIPFSLYPGFTGSEAAFLATVPVVVFMFFPVLLSAGESQQGLLESMGRILLGVLLFVFCAAHLGLLVRREPAGTLELFGLLVIAADLPQRLTGRLGHVTTRAPKVLGVIGGAVLAAGLGFLVGPWCGLVEEDGARAGLLVAVAVTMGAMVTGALVRDLALPPPTVRVGRGAFLDRAIPAVYAAPVFFHYLNFFA